jgi:acetyl esterase
VLVYFHGGGYVFCGLDTHDQLCRMLTNRGRCVVVSVDYRLAPEHPFPAGVEDAWAVTRWVQDNAAEVHGDRERVAVGGDSAGGNFAAGCPRRSRSATPAPIRLLLYPGVDRRGGYASSPRTARATCSADASGSRMYLPEGTAPDDWRHSPMCAPSHAGTAPALVLTAEFDPLRDEGDAYATRLVADGVPVTHMRAEGMIHGFLQYAPFHDGARAILDDVGAALRRALA